jgi:hypothetical protein
MKAEVVRERSGRYAVTADGVKVAQHRFRWTAVLKSWLLRLKEWR